MRILGIYGSPREGGNTDVLLSELLRGAAGAGAEAAEIYARKLTVAPCRACHVCDRTGKCVMRDDFDAVADELEKADALVFATPIHFYTVSAHAMLLIDRAQSQWADRFVKKDERYTGKPLKPAALLAVGATRGKKLFDGLKLTAQYFFYATGYKLEHEILVPGVDEKGAILEVPEALKEAYDLGAAMAGEKQV